jgi:hypothetical protein
MAPDESAPAGCAELLPDSNSPLSRMEHAMLRRFAVAGAVTLITCGGPFDAATGHYATTS